MRLTELQVTMYWIVVFVRKQCLLFLTLSLPCLSKWISKNENGKLVQHVALKGLKKYIVKDKHYYVKTLFLKGFKSVIFSRWLLFSKSNILTHLSTIVRGPINFIFSIISKYTYVWNLNLNFNMNLYYFFQRWKSKGLHPSVDNCSSLPRKIQVSVWNLFLISFLCFKIYYFTRFGIVNKIKTFSQIAFLLSSRVN